MSAHVPQAITHFFNGKRVLVTGVAGVKGSWLGQQLLEAGSSVVGLDIVPPDPESNFVASDLAARIDFEQGDVNDLKLVRRLVDTVDCVFHLAAVVLVGEALRNPWETYRTNTLGTATVLEAIRLSDSAKYGVFITTDKVYKSKHGECWVEDDPLVASGPYPVSKACAEFVIADYNSQYLAAMGKKIAVARAGNVMVGGDFHSSRRCAGAGRLFVDCVEALSEGNPPVVFRPQYRRPYAYGLDILAGYMALMTKLDHGVAGEAFNFGPHEVEGVENARLASRICELWGGGIQWVTGPPRTEPFDVQALRWDKSRDRLQWQPAYTFDQAVAATVHWYKKWYESGRRSGKGGMYEFNRQLIREHFDASLVR